MSILCIRIPPVAAYKLAEELSISSYKPRDMEHTALSAVQ